VGLRLTVGKLDLSSPPFMHMSSRFLRSLLFSCLATAACAQVAPVTYDFNGYTNNSGTTDYEGAGYWSDANGWSTTESGGYFFVSTTDSADGSSYVRFVNVGGGVGATASIADTFGSVRTDEQFSFSFSYLDHNYWGTIVGVRSSSDTGGIALTVSGYNGLTLAVGGSTVGTASFDFSGVASWYDFRVDLNVGANGGSGAASVYYRLTGGGAWSAVTGMAGLDLGLDATRTDGGSANPENWNTLWFHHEGANSGIDNVAIGAIPEPAAYAAFLAAAALGLASYRRRASGNGSPSAT
jgi:hypothetical protein